MKSNFQLTKSQSTKCLRDENEKESFNKKIFKTK
jgi:hypothetical protein